MCEHVFSFLLSVYLSRVASSYGDFMSDILNSCQTVFKSGCTILQSHQQYMRILISPYFCQHFFFFFFVFMIIAILVGMK